ncbi:MAG: hypothetical protein M0P26_05105 [Bacteroidales bacterium]|nr:hypothetical protein [Bacteroidales bacterium]
MKRLNGCLIFLIALTVISCGRDGEDDLTLPDIEPMSPYDEPVWHPSGEIIGFNHTPIKEIYYNSKNRQVHWVYDSDSTGFWLINADGTNMRRVLPYYLKTPAWSPDGSRIAFSNGAQISIMPFDGEKFDTTAIRLLTHEGKNFFPSWSPDAQWIAYDSNADSPIGQYFIWKMRIDGTSKKCIAYTPDLGETRMPYWKSNFSIVHQRYIEIGTPEIFEMDLTGKNKTRITNNNIHETLLQSSANNKYITYISSSDKWSLNRIDVSTNELINLTNWCKNYSWAHNGEKIVYVNFNSTHIDKTIGNLWTIDADGSNKKPLTYNSFKTL